MKLFQCCCTTLHFKSRITFLLTLPQPGSDSGTTAVVALIRGKQLIVANAGDSRCVVSERGAAHAAHLMFFLKLVVLCCTMICAYLRPYL